MSQLQTPSTNTSKSEPTQNSDINDIFDAIALCEDRKNAEGYEKGVADGKLAGNTEGYHLGYHRGAELGAELGYYYGMLQAYSSSDRNKTDRQRKSIESVLKLIDNFPRINDDQTDIFTLADSIRAQYRKTCAILKISGKYPDADQLSF